MFCERFKSVRIERSKGMKRYVCQFSQAIPIITHKKKMKRSSLKYADEELKGGVVKERVAHQSFQICSYSCLCFTVLNVDWKARHKQTNKLQLKQCRGDN